MDISREQLEQQLASDNLGQQLSAINQLRNIDPALAFELIQPVLTDRSARVRYAAISQLSELGKQNKTLALEILRNALHHDPEADVQGAAADSIGALQLTEAFGDLEQVYRQTTEWLVQMSIVACLGELGEPRAFELLEKALTSENSLIVLAAIGALGELQDERALPLLLPFANHEDWQIRHRLVQALSKYQHPESQATLQKLTQDPSGMVAETARTHLLT
jgi:HEAT repeat protein